MARLSWKLVKDLNADEAFESLAHEMLEKLLGVNPDYGTSLGLHDPYDYLMPKGGTDRLLENLRLEEEWIRRLKQMIRYEALNEDHRLDWEVIEKSHEDSKFLFYERRMHELNPDAFEVVGGLVFMMFTRDYAPFEKRIDAIAARTEKTPKYLEEFRTRFDKSKPVRLWTEVAIEVAQSMQGLYEFVLQAAKGKVSDRVYERLEEAIGELQPALKDHLRWLNDLLGRTAEEWWLGREKFEKLIKLRQLGMTSEEILKIGEKYLKDLKAERSELARKIAPGKPLGEIMKAIEDKAPKTFEEALESTKKSMEEAKHFVQERNLATVYPEDRVLVTETPAFIAPLIPFAAMSMPSKFDKPQIGVYIVTRPKEAANLGKHLNFSAVRTTAVHEAFPGHFLQGAVSNRGSFVRLFADGTETVEGWAHYCEDMMAEEGFLTDKETQLIHINDMIWRAVRIIVDVKLARGEMSFEEAVKLLMQEADMSKEAAVAEVRRYTMTPGYPLSYLLGKHLITKLKEEVIQKMGAKFTKRFFNDTIIANGYLPVSMVRKIFDQKISKAKSSE